MIIDFKSERAKRSKPIESYHVRVDIYEDGIAGSICDLGDDIEPEEARIVANHLITLSRYIKDKAFEEDGNEEENLIAMVQIFKNSRVWSFVQSCIETEYQCEWVDRRLDEAKELIRQKEQT